jgi:hypothetical protein
MAALLVVGGGALRLHRSTTLSLWLDEGFTIQYARLSWDSVLGLHGAYDPHPPLYYALVKAFTLVLPEVVAGRLLSVLAGTATIAVLYVLVARVAGRPVALVACLVAAVSPLAVWYSQEARQYAVTGLAVSVAYLALVAFHLRPTTRWALAYGAALASAVYLDYSALYALAPQIVLLPFVVYCHQRRAIPIVVAGITAVAAYVPWLPNVAGTVREFGTGRASYLGATPTAIVDSLLSVSGLGGQGIYFASATLSPWTRWSAADAVLGTTAIAAIVLGGVALAGHRLGIALGLAMSAGTLIAAVLLSQLSPGFAPRTVSYAVLGWAVLLGAAAAGGGMSIPRRVAGCVAVGAMLVVSMASLQAVYDGKKQDWRSWASGVAEAARFGYPVVTFPGVASTFLEAYEPDSITAPRFALGDAPDLTALGAFVDGRPAMWFASSNIASGIGIDPYLRSIGLERVAHQDYFYGLSLGLYVRSGVTPGRAVEINAEFTDEPGDSSSWRLTPDLSSVWPAAEGPELTLSNPGGSEVTAVLTVPGAPHHLYSLTFEARSSLGSGGMRAFLICEGSGRLLNVAPDGAGAGVAADSMWHTLTVIALCPDGTEQLRIDLRNAGIGALELRDIRLYEAAPP